MNPSLVIVSGRGYQQCGGELNSTAMCVSEQRTVYLESEINTHSVTIGEIKKKNFFEAIN